MSSNVIKLLGVVISILMIYLCVDMNKNTIAAKLGIHKITENVSKIETKKVDEHINETQVEATQVVKTIANVEKSDPAFGMIIDKNITIVGMFSPVSVSGRLINYINQLCEHNQCDNDIRYSKDIKDINWQNDMVDLIKLLREAKIEQASIFVNSNTLKIEGDLASIDNNIQAITKKLKSDGLTMVGEKIKVNHSEKKINTVKSKSLQEKIDDMLKNNTISFTQHSNNIDTKSEKVLDEISTLLSRKKDIKFDIIDYIRLGNDKIFSKVMSQKRADILKKYFLKKGLNPKKSIGLGDKEDTQVKIIINK